MARKKKHDDDAPLEESAASASESETLGETQAQTRTAAVPVSHSARKDLDFSPSALLARNKSHVDELAHKRGYYVRHAEKGWHYRWFDPRGRSAQALQSKRDDLILRGFQPVNGPMGPSKRRAEYMPARPSVEIWRTTDEVNDRNRERRQRRAAESPVWLKMQSVRKKRRGAYVPEFAYQYADPETLQRLGL